MADQKKVSVILSGTDKLSSIVGTATKGIVTFGEKTEGIQKRLGILLETFGAFEGFRGIAGALGIQELPGQVASVDQSLARLTNRFKTLQDSGVAPFRQMMDRNAKATGIGITDQLAGLGPLLSTDLPQNAVADMLTTATKAAMAYGGSVGDAALAESGLYLNLKIAGDQMPSAFGMLSAEIENSNIGMQDLIPQIPLLSRLSLDLGMSGTKGLSQIGAAAAVVSSKFNTAQDALGATEELLQGILSKRSQGAYYQFWQYTGQNILASVMNASKQGLDPIHAFADQFNKATNGMTEARKTALLNLFTKGDRVDALRALIEGQGEYQQRIDDTADALDRFQKDQDRATKNMTAQWKIFSEKVKGSLDPIIDTIERGAGGTLKLLNQIPGAAPIAGLGALGVGLGASFWFGQKALRVAGRQFGHGMGLLPETSAPPSYADPFAPYRTPDMPWETKGPSLFETGSNRAARLFEGIGRGIRTGTNLLFDALDIGFKSAAVPLDILLSPKGVGEGSDMTSGRNRIAAAMRAQFGPAMAPNFSFAGAGGSGGQVQVSVDFRGTPKGVRVDTDASDNIDLRTHVGKQW